MEKITNEEKIEIMRSVAMFREASEPSFAKLADLSDEVSFPQGSAIIVQGKRCPNLYVLVSGEVGIYLRDGESEREVARLSESGKIIGEIGVISGAKSSATIRTLAEETHFLQLTESEFQEIINEDLTLAEAVLRSLVRYL